MRLYVFDSAESDQNDDVDAAEFYSTVIIIDMCWHCIRYCKLEVVGLHCGTRHPLCYGLYFRQTENKKNMRKIYCVPMPMHTHDTFKTNINVSNRMSFAHWRYCLHSICAAKEMLLDNCIFIDVFCLYTIRSLLAILQFCVWPKRIIMTWSQSEPNSHTNIHTIHSYRSPIGTYKKQQPDLIMKNATNVCFVIIYVALRVCVCATKWLEYMRVCYSATITCVSHILFEQTQTHIHSIIIRSSVEFAHIGLRIYWYMQANVRSISSIFWCLLLLLIFS